MKYCLKYTSRIVACLAAILFFVPILPASAAASNASISVNLSKTLAATNSNFAGFSTDPNTINASSSNINSLGINSLTTDQGNTLYNGTIDNLKSVTQKFQYIVDSNYAQLYCTQDSQFYLARINANSNPVRSFTYGIANDGLIPVTGDWNGKGVTGIGVYNPSTHTFALRNALSTGDANITFTYAPQGINSAWIPITGDWTGSGVTKVGYYNPADSSFHLRNTLTTGGDDTKFYFGVANSGVLPVTGDWTGSGKSGVGIYNQTTGVFQLKNSLTTGNADIRIVYGPTNNHDIPLSGYWNGGKQVGIGLYNPTTATFLLRDSLTTGIANLTFQFGREGTNWYPLVGDWYGNGSTLVGQYAYSISTSTKSCLYPGDNNSWANWTRFLTNAANEVKAHNYNVIWEIWNGPELVKDNVYTTPGTLFIQDRGQNQFFGAWSQASKIIHSILPNAAIEGPGIELVPGNISLIEAFLQYQNTNKTLPTYISIHENVDSSVQVNAIPTLVSDIRKWSDNNGVPNIPVNISGYTGPAVDYTPGTAVDYLQNFLDSTILYATHSCWNQTVTTSDCNNGTLAGLLTTRGQATPQWWVYNEYTHMSGNYVSTTTQGDISAISSYNPSTKQITILAGTNGNGTGTTTLRITYIPASNVSIQSYAIPNLTYKYGNLSDGQPIYANPPLIDLNPNYSGTSMISNGILNFKINQMNQWDAYMIKISLGSAPVSTITPSTTAVTPTSTTTTPSSTQDAFSSAPPAGVIKVVDANNMPITDALVEFDGGQALYTDSQGNVTIPASSTKLLLVDSNGTVVTTNEAINPSNSYIVYGFSSNGKISGIASYTQPGMDLSLILIIFGIVMIAVAAGSAWLYFKKSMRKFDQIPEPIPTQPSVQN